MSDVKLASGGMRTAWLGALAICSVALVPGRVGAQASRSAPRSSPRAASPGVVFLLRKGNDTVSVESVERSGNQLHSRLETRTAGAYDYTATITHEHLVSRLDLTAYAPGSRTAAAHAVLSFVGDSVTADVGNGRIQRVATQRGAEPWVNPSVALVELIVKRARLIGSDSVNVPLFIVSGGATVGGTVVKHGADSVVFTISGVALRLHVNAAGDVLGGIVPSQDNTIERHAATDKPIVLSKPDYSAPVGAPYIAEDVRVPTPGGYTLAGTLTIPKQHAAPVPAVVTITGSGLQDRDEALPGVPGYRPFRELADTLSRRGIAVLRLDDRGFGESGGDPTRATTADFANDIRAALAYLRTRRDIDANKLFLVGHSEGAIIAPMIASTDPTLRGIVLLAGSARNGRAVLKSQVRWLAENGQVPGGLPVDSVVKLQEAALDSADKTQPWMHYFLAYDPIATARKVTVPVLVLEGQNDRQVSTDQAQLLGSAFQAGGDKDVTVHVFPGLNHLFLADPTGNPMTYAQLPSTKIGPQVLGTIADWIVRHAQG